MGPFDTRRMFVQHSVHVSHPVAVCTVILANGPRKWFPQLSDQKFSAVGPRIAGVPVRKKVVVEVGAPVSVGQWTEIPVTWRATFPQKLFPVLVGKVELAPIDPRVTRLTVSGVYQPPLGKIGEQLNEVLLHGVAEETIKDLAESISHRVDSEALRAEKSLREGAVRP